MLIIVIQKIKEVLKRKWI